MVIIFRSSWSPWNSVNPRRTTFSKNILKHRKNLIWLQLPKFSRSLSLIWHQSINWTWIEILLKMNLEKALKLDFLITFFEKVFYLRFKEFPGLHNDLKLFEMTPGRYSVQKLIKLDGCSLICSFHTRPNN